VPARRPTVTNAERDALLADLNAYSDLALYGAQAIIDEVELGTRVAESLARGPAA
jgi:hypothetical protein